MSPRDPSESLAVSVWSYFRPRWYQSGLTIATLLFVYSTAADLRAERTFTAMVRALGDEGGGLLVVTQVGECVQTLAQLDEVAGRNLPTILGHEAHGFREVFPEGRIHRPNPYPLR